MSIPNLKLIVAGLALVVAFSYLGVTATRSGWVYYVDVDEFIATPSLQGARTRIHGRVAREGLERDADASTVRFQLSGQASHLLVVYEGAIPDTFSAGRDVLVEGRTGGDGVFHADVLLTKCASKYRSQPLPEASDRPGTLAEGPPEDRR